MSQAAEIIVFLLAASGFLPLSGARAQPMFSHEPRIRWPPGDSPQMAFELDREVRQVLQRWEDNERLLGERKRLRLEVARFHLATRDYGRRFEDEPAAHEETKDILRSVVGKLARERFLESPPIASVLQRFETVGDSLEEKTSSWRVRISPRFGLGKDAHMGANLSLKRAGEKPWWSRLAIGFRERLERGESTVFIQYEDDFRFLRLEQARDDDGHRSLAVRIRWLF